MADDKRDDKITGIIQTLLDEYTELTKTIDALELRRARVKAALLPLMAIEDNDPSDFAGTLADACRVVLQNREGSLTPTQVRDAVQVLGYNLGKHDNVMASIHGVLKSLETQGQVKTKEWRKDPGVTRYYWVGPAIATPESTAALRRLGQAFKQPDQSIYETGLPVNLPLSAAAATLLSKINPDPPRYVRDDLQKQMEEDKKKK